MEEQLKIDFDKVVKSLKPSKKDIELREKNLNEFIKNGFPNKRIEDWKFSDLNQIISSNIKELKFFNDETMPDEFDQSILINSLDHNKIILINGLIFKFDFNYEEKDKIEVINAHETEDFNSKNSLVSLNNALKCNYVKLTIKENYSLNKPLIIYNITNKKLKSNTINQRIDFILKKNSSLRLVNLFDDSSNNNFININYQFKIEREAILKNYIIDHKLNSNIKYFLNNINLEYNSVAETFIFSTGSKMGKTEKGAVWLDKKLLSSYDYWQYWRNTDDRDVLRFLKMYTDITLEKIEEIKNKDINQLKIILANECTKTLHGDKEAKLAEQTAKKTFAEGLTGAGLPVVGIKKTQIDQNLDILNLILLSRLENSKSEIRRIIKNKGVKINNSTIDDEKLLITNSLFDSRKTLKLSLGKKRHIKVKLV